MNSYVRGNAINLVEKFWAIDPLTQERTPADPTTVTFTVTAPDGLTSQVFVFGTDMNVTNPEVGAYVCALDPQLPTGIYPYRCVGEGAVQAARDDSFEVLESAAIDADRPDVAVYGPCTPWIDGSDVYAFDPTLVDSDESRAYELDTDAAIASQIVWDVSGRRFPGICSQKARPCSQPCGCFGALGSLESWYWTTSWFGGTGWWRNEQGATCGCGALSTVRLSGYPVREILEVLIDGDAVDASGYRLDGRRDLVRLADSSAPYAPRLWPSCQNLDRPDSEPGTFSVTYSFGQEPPQSGKWAAAQLAAELHKARTTGKCRLPNRVTKVVRQGVTIDRVVPTASLLRQGATGLEFLDVFIGAVNPTGSTRPPAIYSPDSQQFARKVGQGGGPYE